MYACIVKVVDGVIQDGFDFEVLEYGQPTMQYFGLTQPPKAVQGKIAAVYVEK